MVVKIKEIVRLGIYFYRPQRSYSYSQVILFTGVCQSFCSRGGLPQFMLGYTPWHVYPPRQVHTPQQVYPPRAGTHPLAGTPAGRYTPLGRYPPRYTPWQVAPCPPFPPPPAHDGPLKRTVCILLECFSCYICNRNYSIETRNILLKSREYTQSISNIYRFQ